MDAADTAPGPVDATRPASSPPPRAGLGRAASVVAEHAAYYPHFDWLRMTLALVVVLVHEGLLDAWKPAGNFAVQVFFALSGWLIGRVLLKTAPNELPRFYFNRAVRIWVPYYVALALLVAASLLKEPVTAKWLEFVLYKLLFVYNLFGTQQLAAHMTDMPLDGTGNHFWSVNAEEQFYLLAPLLLVLGGLALRRSAVLWIAIAAAAWFSGLYASIAFGVAAAVALNEREGVLTHRGFRLALAVLLLCGAAGLWQGFDYTWLAPPIALGIVLLLATRGARQPIGAFFGGLSYPLYLNHWIGVFVANAALQPVGLRDSPLRHVVSVGTAVLIAAALYWYVDRRLLQRRHAMYTPALGRGALVTAYGTLAAGLACGLYWAAAS